MSCAGIYNLGKTIAIATGLLLQEFCKAISK